MLTEKSFKPLIFKDCLDPKVQLPPLPLQRPLLMIGHGSRDPEGKQNFLDFATAYQTLDRSRPVVPCFLELSKPTILDGVDRCVEQGYTDLSALPILLFAARHNKFDVTNELDRARKRHPQVRFHYGRHFGIAPSIVELWRSRLAALDAPQWNPQGIERADTVLLFIGRGSSDPDANGEVCKLARILWEGSGYATVESCFIGITHPRLEEGLRRAQFYRPKRIAILPYFLFTGVLVKKIFDTVARYQQEHPETILTCLPEMGIHPALLSLLREREIETQVGQVQMNCEMCKFRLAATLPHEGEGNHPDRHHHHHHHAHHPDHHHHQEHSAADQNSAPASMVTDPYADPAKYHERIWQVP